MEFMGGCLGRKKRTINQQIGFSGFSNMPFFAIFVSAGG